MSKETVDGSMEFMEVIFANVLWVGVRGAGDGLGDAVFEEGGEISVGGGHGICCVWRFGSDL